MLKIDEGILWPELGSEFFTQHNLRRALEQQSENLQRLSVEPDCMSVFAKLPSAKVELEGTEALGHGRLRGFRHDPPRFARSLAP